MLVRRAGIGLALLLLQALAWSAPDWRLTIVHTNDTHGMMMPFDYESGGRKLPNVGGLARRASAVAQIRRGLDHASVLLDCGDFFARGPWHARFMGAPEVDAYNLMGYDLLCVGNNEFKATGGVDAQEAMLRLARRSRFPWLAANVTVGDTGVPIEGIRPFVVRVLDGVRVGFLGLTAPRSGGLPQTQGWRFSDPLAAARKWVPIARRECDILIAVTHIGEWSDRRLAAEVPGIDAIVGGDSHTYLRAPLLIRGPEGADVPVAQAGESGVVVGRLDLTFTHSDRWRLTHTEGRLVLIDRTYTEDPAVKALLDRWLRPAATSRLAPAGWASWLCGLPWSPIASARA